ncbi:MAG: hypothetical protein HY996_03805 [Micrococcales bacterium]|nr:hypothetical protein [Micrococcales bacterium]
MADRQNRARGVARRIAVARALRLLGLAAATPRTTALRSMAEAIETGQVDGDVTGIRSWFIQTRADLSPQWGPSLDAAEQGAVLAGERYGAVIQFRSGRGAQDAFVCISMRTVADLVKRANGEPDPCAEFERFQRQQDAAEV